MGTVGRKIVGVKVDELINLMNKALADDWVGAKVAVGRMRGIVAGELEEHANEELKHANMLTDRIIQMGGTPLLNPEQWKKESNCGYDTPSDPNTKKLLEQNIKGEQCAIGVYTKLLKKVEGKDSITYHIILEILEDEVKHEDDLEAILEEMKTKVG